MTDLRWYKLRLVLVFLVAIGGIVLWANLNGIEGQSCLDILKESGITLENSNNLPGSCSELDYQNAINASDRIAICDETGDSVDTAVLEKIKDHAFPSGSCSVISQDFEFDNNER